MNCTEIETFLGARAYARSTQESYRYALARLAAWLEERGITLDTLSVERYLEFLNGHGWSNNMRRLYASAARSFWIWKHKDREHACFAVKLPKDDALPGRSLDETGLRDLLASFDTTTAKGWRDLAMAALMVETGLRASEICRLEMSRLDMRGRRFTVLAKGQTPREGVFSEDTKRFLEIWLSERPGLAKPRVRAVFVSVRGKRPGTAMTRDGLRSLYRKFGKQSGIGPLSPHDMRRTMAALLTERNAPTRVVQILGAWKDIRMVVRYTRRLRPSHIDRFTPIKALVEELALHKPSSVGSGFKSLVSHPNSRGGGTPPPPLVRSISVPGAEEDAKHTRTDCIGMAQG